MKNTLYKISQELDFILNQLEENGGEITPEIEQALAITQEQFAYKCEDYAAAILNIEAIAAAAKAEKDRLAKLQKFYDDTAKRLRTAISTAMQRYDIPKVENGTMRVFLRHTQIVADDYDINAIPKKYKKAKIEVAPDKTAIKKAILEAYEKAKEDGEADDVTKMGAYIKGVRLEDNYNIQIK
jgi:hypothetical protein